MLRIESNRDPKLRFDLSGSLAAFNLLFGTGLHCAGLRLLGPWSEKPKRRSF